MLGNNGVWQNKLVEDCPIAVPPLEDAWKQWLTAKNTVPLSSTLDRVLTCIDVFTCVKSLKVIVPRQGGHTARTRELLWPAAARRCYPYNVRE